MTHKQLNVVHPLVKLIISIDCVTNATQEKMCAELWEIQYS
jgi:hypothetical protein